ncbi:MAG: glycosyltransferase family 9 protein [Candidatus Omnitrophica bacterium]|nr:glycosyltransferase family 9 protein [Candidatus Omnitrophota bacterium]
MPGPEKSMNILVVTLSNFGDVILTTPVIMALVRKYPEARITVVVGPRARSVLQRSSDIHKTVIYDKKASFFQKMKFIAELRKVKYDRVVDLRNTAIPFLVSCKKRTPLFRKFTKVNMRDRHLEMLATVESNIPTSSAFQFFNKADEVFAMRALDVAGVLEKKGWILVAAGAASERKRWAVRNFRDVIRTLHEKTGKKILLVGTLDERFVADSILAELPGIGTVLCGDLILSEVAALIANASLVVANDSAIMHLGFELGTPTVGIFGPTDHEKYGHEGPKFRVARGDAQACSCGSDKLPRAERSCFHGLKPEKVTSLCLELLNGDLR